MDADAPVLKDIHLPAAPGAWPPAPGWWILAVMLLALVAFLAWRSFKNCRKQQREMAIVAELRRVRAAWLQHADTQRLTADLSQFLRRLSRAVAPRSVALAGDEWLAFLDRHGDGFGEQGSALTLAPYRPGMAVDADDLYTLVERHLYSVLHKEGWHV
jgi:hypothetical protein